MRSIFYRVLDWARWLFGIVPKSAVGSAIVFRVLHFTFVILITVLLAYFSDRIKDPAQIDLPFPLVKRYWCGILFLLSYFAIRLVISLIGLLRIVDNPEFADIDRCWAAGMEALQREGLDFKWLPVFLVNGLTPEEELSTFQAARMPWRVTAPRLDDSSAVLRFFANDEAIFICCTGVGAMSRQVTKLATSELGAGGTMLSVAAAAQGGGQAMGTLRSPDIQAARGPAQPGGGATQLAPSAAANGQGGVMNTLRSVASFIGNQTMMPGAGRQTILPGQFAVPRTAAAASPTWLAVTPDEVEIGPAANELPEPPPAARSGAVLSD